MKATPVEINGVAVNPGSRVTVDLPVARLYTHTNLAMPVQVIHGKISGPTLFVSAAIHGDELNGVEVIRRLLKHSALKRLRGTVFAIPIVNVHGLLDRSRYLPDRRDLNRSFPGSERGSLAARVAKIFMEEIVARSNYGIDLHTGALHRENIPQIRTSLDDAENERLARAFGVPIVLNSDIRDNSLREAATEKGIPLLVYEGGEALRFNEIAIRAGLRGILNVMRLLEMLPVQKTRKTSTKTPMIARSSTWVRAPESGILRTVTPLGGKISKGSLLGVVSPPYGEDEYEIPSPADGIVIGRTHLPLVHEGEALYHVARFGSVDRAAEKVEAFHEVLQPEWPEEPDQESPIV